MKIIPPSQYTPEYVSDRLQLTDLCVRYAVGVDRKDWDVFRSCFTEDAIIDYTSVGGERHGVEAMVEYLSNALAPFVGTQHFILNHEVEFDGDTARGRLGCYNPMPVQTDQGRLFYLIGVWYIDEYRRTPEGWKISSRFEEPAFDSSKFAPLQQFVKDPSEGINESPESIAARKGW